MNTAKLLKDNLSTLKTKAALYELTPPLKDDEGNEHKYVVVSATIPMFGPPETYIFPADENGEVTAWSELPGSIQGSLEHSEALEAAGYQAA